MSDDKPFYEPSEQQEENLSEDNKKPCFELYIKVSGTLSYFAYRLSKWAGTRQLQCNVKNDFSVE